jgi:hypothetical protein
MGMPVVNMGLHANLGLPYMLNEARAVARSGDIVILSIEYDHIYQDFGQSELHRLLCHRPAALAYLDGPTAKRLLDDTHIFFGGITRSAILRLQTGRHTERTALYVREAFNAYGDVIIHYNQPSPWRVIANSRPLPNINIDVLGKNMRLLRHFLRRCEKESITVFFSFPPYPIPKAGSSATQIEILVEALNSCEGLTLLDRPERHAYPWELFYNTKYHLSRDGAALRTAHLAEDLKAWQERSRE